MEWAFGASWIMHGESWQWGKSCAVTQMGCSPSSRRVCISKSCRRMARRESIGRRMAGKTRAFPVKSVCGCGSVFGKLPVAESGTDCERFSSRESGKGFPLESSRLSIRFFKILTTVKVSAMNPPKKTVSLEIWRSSAFWVAPETSLMETGMPRWEASAKRTENARERMMKIFFIVCS